MGGIAPIKAYAIHGTSLLDASLRSKKQNKNATSKGDVLHSISLQKFQHIRQILLRRGLHRLVFVGKPFEGLFQPLCGGLCGGNSRLQIGQLGQYSQLAGIKNV